MCTSNLKLEAEAERESIRANAMKPRLPLDAAARRHVSTVLLLCGLPAAGKSSVGAAVACDAAVRAQFDVVRVAVDDVVAELEDAASSERCAGGAALPWSAARWHAARVAALERVGALVMSDEGDGAARPRLVLVEDNFYYRSMRRQYFVAAREARAAYAAVLLDVDADASVERDATRAPPARVGAPVIRRMAALLEPPGDAPWEAVHVLCPPLRGGDCASTSDALGAMRAAELVRALLAADLVALVPRVTPAPGAGPAAGAWQADALHAADVRLRRCVGAAVRRSTAGAAPSAPAARLDAAADAAAESRRGDNVRLPAAPPDAANAARRDVLDMIRAWPVSNAGGGGGRQQRHVAAFIAASGGGGAGCGEPAEPSADAFLDAVEALFTERLEANARDLHA